MIISRTPFRISFFGGGTDYPAWFKEHGGTVLSTSINRYCYITCRLLPPFFEHRSRVVWGQVETVKSNSEIIHPVVRETLSMMGISEGVEIHYDGDLPARTGLGSSSSFTVGILNALHAMQGHMTSKEELANMAIHVEQNLLKENVGIQDQIAAAYGGFNRVDISPNGSFRVTPVTVRPGRVQALQGCLMLFYTGISRMASEVAGDKIKLIPQKQAELHRMQSMVNEGIDILASDRDLDDFGRLLHEAWQLKRGLSTKVSSDFVDDIYHSAIGAGAIGGKLLGAGGGGFMLFYVPPAYQPNVLKALESLLCVPIEFDYSGSQIIFYNVDPYTRQMFDKTYQKVLA